jgi:predicted RNase H-like nuclease
MQHRKRGSAGRKEREALIEIVWPGLRDDLTRRLRGTRHEPDDLNDALAALWTARRIAAGVAVVFPTAPATDRFGLRMEIVA